MCCSYGCCSDMFLVLLSVFFPPLAVWIRVGLCTADSLINILLCVLGYFPGLIHAWYIIAKNPPYPIYESSHVYYVFRPSDLENQTQGTHDNFVHHPYYCGLYGQELPQTNQNLNNHNNYGSNNEIDPPAYSDINK